MARDPSRLQKHLLILHFSQRKSVEETGYLEETEDIEAGGKPHT